MSGIFKNHGMLVKGLLTVKDPVNMKPLKYRLEIILKLG